MPFTHEQAVEAGRRRWAGVSPEERRKVTRRARLAGSAKQIVEQWPELTDEQQQRLRSLLRPVPEGGGDDG